MSGYEGPRGKIYQSILETIGGTPLVRCQRIKQTHALNVQLLAKLEYFNPMASVKDRIGQHMLQQLEQDGVIGP
jgi:Cysteine synthase